MNERFDVVVVGSGAAGMTAALTAALRGLSVVLIEKTEYYGGATAYSGGAVWIPNNFVMEEAGIGDSVEDARTYMTALAGGSASEACREAYLRAGPAMLRELHERTRWVRWRLLGFPDYHVNLPGGRSSGRTLEAEIVDGRALGARLAELRPPSPAIDLGPVTITANDFASLSMVARATAGKVTAARVAARTAWGLLRRRKLLGVGQALVARLRLSLAEAGVPVWLSSPLDDLVVSESRVVGVRTHRRGEPVTVHARLGVVLASGGFSRNDAMRDTYLPSPSPAEWSMAPTEGQSGDGILAGMAAGGAVDLMHRAWGMPTVIVPIAGAPTPLLTQGERCLPGTIVVDSSGRRYADEALPYEDFWKDMYAHDGAVPSWLIFDQRAKNRYILLNLLPRQPIPRRWLESDVVVKAPTIEALAARMGIPGDGLAATVARFNRLASTGADDDFRRGDSAYESYFGDPTLPAPNLQAIDKSPYYAVRLYPGELSTKGGLKVDEHARVLREDGTAVEGLYATGNCAAAPAVGDSYPGAGGTLGPAMVFGYLAGKHLAARAASDTVQASAPAGLSTRAG